ncbi:unnamed protein product [Schistocephalus solidus]|uniref:Secreted protein n=1 Tax=Schistocephalus solidus TaxID=70667 RepID=A0A183SUN0_SCHSO|nr:unnamed protein product [Schistocephalus solidus]
MRIVALLSVAIVLIAAAEPEIKVETDFTSEYNVVVFINDVGTDLGPELSIIEKAIAGYNQIDPRAGNTLTVIPFPHHLSKKLVSATIELISHPL